MNATAHHSLPALRGNFVLLRAAGLQLLLPQEDVGAAQYLDRAPVASGQPGLHELAGDDGDAPRFVAALSQHLKLLDEFPTGRFMLTPLSAQDGILLCWDEVKVLIDVELQPRALPPVMLPSGAPLTEYVEFGDAIVFCCSGERLLQYAFSAGH